MGKDKSKLKSKHSVNEPFSNASATPVMCLSSGSFQPSSAPTPRSNATLTAGANGNLYLYGGEFFNGRVTQTYGDLYKYDTIAKDWHLLVLPDGSNQPSPRSSHQLVASSTKDTLWLFGGGIDSADGKNIQHYNDMWTFSLNDLVWRKIQAVKRDSVGKSTKRQLPSPRSGHRMIFYADRFLVLFGGFAEHEPHGKSLVDFEYFNDVWIFDTTSHIWYLLETAGSPIAGRSGCIMSKSGQLHILIGWGYSKQLSANKRSIEGVTYNDLFALVPPDTRNIDSIPRQVWEWRSLRIRGTPPNARCGMSVCSVGTNMELAFGGVVDEVVHGDIEGTFFNDLFLWNLDTLKWKPIILSIYQSSADVNVEGGGKTTHKRRIGEDADPFKRLKLTDTPDLNAPTTSTVDSGLPLVDFSDQPCVRAKAMLTFIDDAVYLYGGIREDRRRQLTLGDFYKLDMKSLFKWEKLLNFEVNNQVWFDEKNDDDEDLSLSDGSESENNQDSSSNDEKDQ